MHVFTFYCKITIHNFLISFLSSNIDKPSNPLGPIEVIEASSSCVEFKWRPPKDDGGSPVIHYNLERQQIGRNTWKKIGNTAPMAHYKDSDVDHGRKYCYRIRAITAEGTSEVYETDDIQAGTKGETAFSVPLPNRYKQVKLKKVDTLRQFLQKRKNTAQ